MLDVSQIPSSITAHAPGYIDRENEIIVGLQTEAPLKRAIMPNGGFRMVLNALKAYGYEPDPHVVEAFTKYRKTHNDAVFDAYTADIRRCRSSHILTGLPDAYGRGRIIGDYRRVALYGVGPADRAQAAGEARARRRCPPRTSSATARSCRADPRAQGAASRWPRATASTSRARRATRARAVQWLYFGYLAGGEGAERRRDVAGPDSTFLDIYFERDLAAGTLTEEQAQEIIDDFVIKLRIVPLPAHAGVRRAVRRRSDLGDRVDRRHGRRRPVAGDEDQLPHAADALQPRAGARSRTSRSGTRRGCPTGSGRFAAKVAIDTSSIQFESDEIMRRAWGDDGAIACCVSPMLVGKQMQFFGARANLAKCLLYAINGGRDEISGKQVGPASSRAGRLPRLRRRARAVRAMMDWLAGVYVNAMNVIHYMHDKYAYERIEMALHDYAPLRTMAFGIAGLSVVADSLSAIKYAKVRVRPRRHRPGHRLPDRRRVPDVRQQRQPRGPARRRGSSARS